MSDPKRYRVLWSLEMLPEDFVPEFALNTPHENMFRLSFPDKESAALFIAEIQRFMGGRVLHLLENGIEIKAKL